jgi:hypothetical protein
MFRFVVILLALGWVACVSSETKKEYLQSATGKPGEMVLLLDSTQWNGPLGQELRKVFIAEVPGLPREEPMFSIIYAYPRKGVNLLKQLRNLVIVFTLDKSTAGSQIIQEEFSPETLQRIRTDSTFFLYTTSDEFSRGQEVMYLFSDTEENLIRHIKKNAKQLQNFFNNLEKKRLHTALYKATGTKEITEFLKKENGVSLRVPFGYKMADRQKDFIWLRQMDAQVDKSIFIAWKDYTSEYQLLPDSLVEWRDEVGASYLFEDPETRTNAIRTVTEVPYNPLQASQVNFNNRFAMELRGLWRTNFMGGPFIGYGLVDEARGRLYYIEGFCYSPGKDQRETIRELEAILWTFAFEPVK